MTSKDLKFLLGMMVYGILLVMFIVQTVSAIASV